MALTDKRRVFIEEYLRTWNATEAARIAGYAFPNVEGSKLLVIPSIAEEIKARLDDKVMTANEVLVRLSEQARAEQGSYITATGVVDLPKLIEDGKAHLIKGIKETQFGKVIEFYDAQAALVHIGKHHKLFADKVEHSGPDGGPIKTQEVGIDYSKLTTDQIAELIRIAEFAQSQAGDGAAQPA